MQPSFLPWIGFFDMADLSENIVFLNDVDYSKNSWHNRNQIRTKNGLEWITIPVEKKFTVSKKLKDIKIRFLFIDGDHSKKGVESDISLFFLKCVPGSIIVFDDFSCSPYPKIGVVMYGDLGF